MKKHHSNPQVRYVKVPNAVELDYIEAIWEQRCIDTRKLYQSVITILILVWLAAAAIEVF